MKDWGISIAMQWRYHSLTSSHRYQLLYPIVFLWSPQSFPLARGKLLNKLQKFLNLSARCKHEIISSPFHHPYFHQTQQQMMSRMSRLDLLVVNSVCRVCRHQEAGLMDQVNNITAGREAKTTRLEDEMGQIVSRIWKTYWSRLPWIFQGAPLKVNGNPKNIQGNLTALRKWNRCIHM